MRSDSRRGGTGLQCTARDVAPGAAAAGPHPHPCRRERRAAQGGTAQQAPTCALHSAAAAVAAAAEEECKAEFKPIVQLEEVEVKSGEEDEAALFDA